MEELLYDIEFVKNSMHYKAYVQSKLRPQMPITEYRSPTFEEVLEQVVKDIIDENED